MDEKTTVNFRTIDGNDTGWLTIDTSHRKILGVLKFNYGNKNKYDGVIKGTISGDTLKGHFDFKLNGFDKWYRNPIAWLRKGDKLIMGVGETNMVWGSAYFNPKVPIDYDKGRFIFEKPIK